MKTLMKTAISIFLVVGILHICHAQGNNKKGIMENVKGETAENQTEQPFTIFGITLGKKYNAPTAFAEILGLTKDFRVGDTYYVHLKKPFRHFKEIQVDVTPKLLLVTKIRASCNGKDLLFESFSEADLECEKICNALEEKFNVKFYICSYSTEKKLSIYRAQTASTRIEVTGWGTSVELCIFPNDAFLNKIKQLDPTETELDTL